MRFQNGSNKVVIELRVVQFWTEIMRACSILKLRVWFQPLSHAGQNYWMLIGWDRGHFSLIKRALFVIKRAWLLDADWLSTPALNWFPASNGVWKRIFRNAPLLSLISTRSFHLNVKENQHARKGSHLVEKQKDFTNQKRIHSQRENNLSGDGWCRTKH